MSYLDVHSFLKKYPELIYAMKESQRGWCSPRSWEWVAVISDLAKRSGGAVDERLLLIMVAGLVGEDAAVKFIKHLRFQKALPVVLEMLIGKKPVKIPKNKRPEELDAFVQAVIQNFLSASEHESVILENILTILKALPAEWGFRLIKNIIEAAPAKSEQIFTHPKLGPWCLKLMESMKNIAEEASNDAA